MNDRMTTFMFMLVLYCC